MRNNETMKKIKWFSKFYIILLILNFFYLIFICVFIRIILLNIFYSKLKKKNEDNIHFNKLNLIFSIISIFFFTIHDIILIIEKKFFLLTILIYIIRFIYHNILFIYEIAINAFLLISIKFNYNQENDKKDHKMLLLFSSSISLFFSVIIYIITIFDFVYAWKNKNINKKFENILSTVLTEYNKLNDNKKTEQEKFYKMILKKSFFLNYDDNNLNLLNLKCGICLEIFKNDDKILIIPCFHKFHFDCISKWLKIKKTCPLDNIKLNKYLNNNDINNVNFINLKENDMNFFQENIIIKDINNNESDKLNLNNDIILNEKYNNDNFLDLLCVSSKYYSIHFSELEKYCKICNKYLKESEVILILPCLHIYHKICVNNQLKINNKPCIECDINIDNILLLLKNNYKKININQKNSNISYQEIIKFCKIDKFNEIQYKNEFYCLICLNKYKNEDNIVITSCHHICHENCFKRYVFFYNNCFQCNFDFKELINKNIIYLK